MPRNYFSWLVATYGRRVATLYRLQLKRYPNSTEALDRARQIHDREIAQRMKRDHSSRAHF